jgi:hypothetical protein
MNIGHAPGKGDDMSDKKMRFKLSPELADGSSWAIVDKKRDVLEAVETWCDELQNYAPGESFTVAAVAMSDEEVDALPDL